MIKFPPINKHTSVHFVVSCSKSIINRCVNCHLYLSCTSQTLPSSISQPPKCLRKNNNKKSGFHYVSVHHLLPPNQPPLPPNQGDVRRRMTRSIFHNDGAGASNSEAPPSTAEAHFVPIGDRTFLVANHYIREGKKYVQSKSKSK